VKEGRSKDLSLVIGENGEGAGEVEGFLDDESPAEEGVNHLDKLSTGCLRILEYIGSVTNLLIDSYPLL